VNPAMSSAPAWRYERPTTPIWSMGADETMEPGWVCHRIVIGMRWARGSR
jgi:hypothetical protein